MFVKLLQKMTDGIKAIYEIGLFAIMSNRDVFLIFNGTPMFYAMMPMVGILYTVSAFINGYNLFKSSNKNLSHWLLFAASALCASLTSISLYGAVIASYYELNFALGPWFFLASTLVALGHQLTMLGINLYSAYESLPKSKQRDHYLQAAFNNLFYTGLIASVIGAVCFVMLSPAAPVLGSACALTAIGFTTAGVLWNTLPVNWRSTIKNVLHLQKQESKTDSAVFKSSLVDDKTTYNNPVVTYKRLFAKWDYVADINSKSIPEGVNYLTEVIDTKLSIYQNLPIPHSEKNRQKSELLIMIKNSLEIGMLYNRNEVMKRYPLAFQSFFAEKGEVESIVDAAYVLGEKIGQSLLNSQVEASSRQMCLN